MPAFSALGASHERRRQGHRIPQTTRIDGRFARGDLVTIEGPDGTLARGLSEYDSDDALLLLGRRSDDHAAILGYAPRSALVHRNHMALL